jgi:hypothetical protein
MHRFLLFVSLTICFFVTVLNLHAQEAIYIMSDGIRSPGLVPYRDGKRWGYADVNGNIVISPQFPEANFFCGELAFVGNVPWQDTVISSCAIINKKGEMLKEFEFAQTFSITDSTAYIAAPNQFVIDKQGAVLSVKEYDYVSFGNGYGLGSTANHDLVFPLDATSNDIDSIIKANKHYYLLNSFGQRIREVSEDSVREFGIADGKGRSIFGGKNPSRCKNGFTYFEKGGTYYYQDAKGNIYTCAYPTYNGFGNYRRQTEDPFVNGSVIMLKDNQYGLIDSDGSILIPFGEYAKLNPFSCGWSLVKVKDDGDEMIYINPKGEVLKPSSKYIFYDDFYGGYAKINFLKGKYYDGFMSIYGKTMVIKKAYEFVGNFSEGLSPVISGDGKYGFIDSTGTEVIPTTLEYDEVGDFSDGLCRVRKDNLYGFINRKGAIEIPITLNYASPFNNGFSELILSSCDYCAVDVINRQGEKQDFYVENAYPWENGRRRCFMSLEEAYQQNMGLLSNGKLLLPVKYKQIFIYPFNIALVILDDEGTKGYINLKTGMQYFKD